METGFMNRIIGLVLALVVGGLLVGGLLIPSIEGMTATEKTFENEGYFTYDVIDENTDVIISWDATAPGEVSIGDKTITMPTGSGNWTIVGSTNFTMRYYTSGTVTGLQCYGSAGYLSANTSNAASGTITINETSMVMTRTNADSTTQTTTYTMGQHGFVINADGKGDLMLKYSNESAYVKGDSEVYLCGTTFVTGSGTNDFVGVFGYGTIDDGLTMSSFYGNTSPNTVSFGDVTATYSAVSGYDDLYKLDKFEFPLTQNSATVTAIYSYFVVPSEVTAEKTNHMDATQIAMFGVISILGIVALVVVAANGIRNKY